MFTYSVSKTTYADYSFPEIIDDSHPKTLTLVIIIHCNSNKIQDNKVIHSIQIDSNSDSNWRHDSILASERMIVDNTKMMCKDCIKVLTYMNRHNEHDGSC